MSETDASFERFCGQAYPRLVAALTHHCGDRDLAEDSAQEALVRACRRWARVRTLDSPVGWCFHVGANVTRSWLRRRRAEQRARERLGGSRTGPGDPADAADRLAVRQALGSLNDRQREAVVLRYYLGLSAGEVAAVTGSTAGAVRVLTHRAVASLRDQLAAGPPGPPPAR